MFLPFDIKDDVSVLARSVYDPNSKGGIRVTVEVLPNGLVKVWTTETSAEPIFAKAGQTLVFDVTSAGKVTQFDLYRLTPREDAVKA